MLKSGELNRFWGRFTKTKTIKAFASLQPRFG
jgi:hypothetical protein